MASPTMVSRLLDAAELLLAHGGRSGAFRRRAVSTAYYAVFHSLAKSSAGALLPDDASLLLSNISHPTIAER
jgi:hypothetical protein